MHHDILEAGMQIKLSRMGLVQINTKALDVHSQSHACSGGSHGTLTGTNVGGTRLKGGALWLCRRSLPPTMQ